MGQLELEPELLVGCCDGDGMVRFLLMEGVDRTGVVEERGEERWEM